MKQLTLLLVALALAGCSAFTLPDWDDGANYVMVGTGPQLNTTDEELKKYDCNWPGVIELGREWDKDCPFWASECKVAIPHHGSYLDCGKPFNDKPEVYQDAGPFFFMKWGGK